MGRWIGLALTIIGIVALVRSFLPAGGERVLRVQVPIMPAFGACADCEKQVPVNIQGRCSMCGSASVVMPWSTAAVKARLDKAARVDIVTDRRRFRRGGQTA